MKAIKTPKIPSSIKYPDFGSKEIRNLFLIDKNITFLNNGSFGATPKIILDYQDAIRQRMEMQPVNFVVQQLPVLLRESLQKIAPFLGANADDLAFVDNATTGANTVIQSLMQLTLTLLSTQVLGADQASQFLQQQVGQMARLL
jgi:selenocysteine lyase/cysteine desulfurase